MQEQAMAAGQAVFEKALIYGGFVGGFAVLLFFGLMAIIWWSIRAQGRQTDILIEIQRESIKASAAMGAGLADVQQGQERIENAIRDITKTLLQMARISIDTKLRE